MFSNQHLYSRKKPAPEGTAKGSEVSTKTRN